MLELDTLSRRYGRTEATCEKCSSESGTALLVPYERGRGTKVTSARVAAVF